MSASVGMRHRLKSRNLGSLEYLQLRDSTSISNAKEWTELPSSGVLIDDHLRNRLPSARPDLLDALASRI